MIRPTAVVPTPVEDKAKSTTELEMNRFVGLFNLFEQQPDSRLT